jgi:hypothetical protein
MSKVALVFVFNHRYDKNIEKLEQLYGSRFSNIYHLVPFYDGIKENVIPVYEVSFYFQGYFKQALHRLGQKPYAHYLFVGDDLILHPSLNEHNIIEKMGLDDKTGFLPFEFGLLSKMSLEWKNLLPSLNAFYMADHLRHHSVNWRKALPGKADAEKVFARYGHVDFKITEANLKGEDGSYKYPGYKEARKDYLSLMLKRRRTLPYPMLAAYSDFIVVPSKYLQPFAEMCEVFRQMRLWVEVAIPTAMLLTIPKVKMEKDMAWNGTTYWEHRNFDVMNDRYKKAEFKLDKLLEGYLENELYIHPVKLSQWQV